MLLALQVRDAFLADSAATHWPVGALVTADVAHARGARGLIAAAALDAVASLTQWPAQKVCAVRVGYARHAGRDLARRVAAAALGCGALGALAALDAASRGAIRTDRGALAVGRALDARARRRVAAQGAPLAVAIFGAADTAPARRITPLRLPAELGAPASIGVRRGSFVACSADRPC